MPVLSRQQFLACLGEMPERRGEGSYSKRLFSEQKQLVLKCTRNLEKKNLNFA